MPIETIDPATPVGTPVRSRRALLTAALGGLGGLLASRLGAPEPTAAAAGGPFVLGAANSAGTSNSSLTTASTGTALLVTQNGSGTALRGSAVGPGSIAGFFTAANGTGISGVTASPNTYGVFGSNDGAAGTGAAIRASGKNNNGLAASTANPAKAGVFASNSGIAGTGAAIQALGGDNIGVDGLSTTYTGVRGTSSGGTGVLGSSTSSYGVQGYSANAAGVAAQSVYSYGLYGYSSFSYAGYFDGPLYAASASASVKAFRIDHPLDPANKVLEHSCVESNERKLVYDGIATTDARGEATIELPAWFEALNGDLRYQLTPLADSRAWVTSKVKGGRFRIATSAPGTEVCWQVTGVRQDVYSKAHPLVVEQVKEGREKGRFLNPVEHGQPAAKGVAYELRQQAKEGAQPRR
jgi:hypothetical protein